MHEELLYAGSLIVEIEFIFDRDSISYFAFNSF